VKHGTKVTENTIFSDTDVTDPTTGDILEAKICYEILAGNIWVKMLS
jgi:hypothetical protein